MSGTTIGTHRCPAPGCRIETANHLLACRKHWFSLPLDVRNAIYYAYRPGQTAVTASPAYNAAYERALAHWGAS